MSKKSRSGRRSAVADQGETERGGPPFAIRMGFPHMDALWNDQTARFQAGKLSGNKTKLYKKWGKALRFLAADPFHPGLNSHEITALSQKYGKKVFESYLENRTPGAARMFWAYGPGRAEITILALEPHPEPGEYGRVKLDTEP